LRDRIASKVETQSSLAIELKMSQGHLSKLLKTTRLAKKSRSSIAGYLLRPDVVGGEADHQVTTRRVMHRCEQIMHNMQLTDVQRMCDQMAPTDRKAEK
jgi:hypothetical protein